MNRLPNRAGARPRTSAQTPHTQLDQQPTDDRFTAAVIDEARRWPQVVAQESGISVEGAQALVLDDGRAGGGPGTTEAFLIGREFCHAHPNDDLSFHAALPLDLAVEAERAGWVEPHFLVRTGRLPATIVMIYAPRDEDEYKTVLQLVRSSYEFALSQADITGHTGLERAELR